MSDTDPATHDITFRTVPDGFAACRRHRRLFTMLEFVITSSCGGSPFDAEAASGGSQNSRRAASPAEGRGEANAG